MTRTTFITAGALATGILLGSLTAAHAADDATVALYEKKCKVCHSIGGDAGKLADKGGALDGVGGKRDEAWLRAYLADPKSQIPDAKMPNLKLAPADLDALVAYMLSLK